MLRKMSRTRLNHLTFESLENRHLLAADVMTTAANSPPDAHITVDSTTASFAGDVSVVPSYAFAVVGDATHDGVFDSADLLQAFQCGQFEDAGVANSSWECGDFDGDQEFTSSDLVLAFEDGDYLNAGRSAEKVVSVEPLNATSDSSFFDDFDSGILSSAWSHQTGTWQVVSGALEHTGGSNQGRLTLNKLLDANDYTIEADFIYQQEASNSIGFIFRFEDLGNYYYVDQSADLGRVKLFKVVDGSKTKIMQTHLYQEMGIPSFDLPLGVENHFQLKVEGNQIQYFYGSDLILDLTDGDLDSGTVGVFSSGKKNQRLDNFSAMVGDGPTILVDPVPATVTSSPLTLTGTKSIDSSVWIDDVEVIQENVSSNWTFDVDLVVAGPYTLEVTARSGGEISNPEIVEFTFDPIIDPAAPHFFDDFNSGFLSSDWQVQTGVWQVVDGELQHSGGGSNGRVTVDSNLITSDYELEADFIYQQTTSNSLGFIFRYENLSNYYYIDQSADLGRVKLFKIVNGQKTKIAQSHLFQAMGVSSFDLPLDVENHFRLIADGDQIQYYYDDNLILDVTDGDLAFGSIGAFSSGQKMQSLDNYRVAVDIVQSLIDVSMDYFGPGFQEVDPMSGYPVEGFNQIGYTQPTNIGFYAQLMANVAAGRITAEHVPVADALARLDLLSDTLLADQANPNLTRDGLFTWMQFQGAQRVRDPDTFGQQIAAGDNLNMSAAIGTAIGALMDQALAGNSTAEGIVQKLEQFLDNQIAGYQSFFNTGSGLFYRLQNWSDGAFSGSHNYFGDEFRGAILFSALRHGIDVSVYDQLNVEFKPYVMQDESTKFVVSPFDGGAFQILWPTLTMPELNEPALVRMVEDFVDVAIDFAGKNTMSGFVSASYVGEGVYVGGAGINQIAQHAVYEDNASLYTLGAAHQVRPFDISLLLNQIVSAHPDLISDHGLWEGINGSGDLVQEQIVTNVATFVLGLVGTGTSDMTRYLEFRELDDDLAAVYADGDPLDVLASFAASFDFGTYFHAFTFGGNTHNISGRRLAIRYRTNSMTVGPIDLELKVPTTNGPQTVAVFQDIPIGNTGNQESIFEINIAVSNEFATITELVFGYQSAADRSNLEFIGIEFV